MNSNNNSGFWTVVFLVVIIAAIVGSLSSNNSSSSSSSSQYGTGPTAGADRGSFEHRYVTERFKQEGYSTAESQQAADAIIKFQNAQKARQR